MNVNDFNLAYVAVFCLQSYLPPTLPKDNGWKLHPWTPGRGDSFWKPSFSDSMSSFGGVSPIYPYQRSKFVVANLRRDAVTRGNNPKWLDGPYVGGAPKRSMIQRVQWTNFDGYQDDSLKNLGGSGIFLHLKVQTLEVSGGVPFFEATMWLPLKVRISHFFSRFRIWGWTQKNSTCCWFPRIPNFYKYGWSTCPPGPRTPPEIAGVPYDQGLLTIDFP